MDQGTDTGVGSLTGSKRGVWQWSRGSGGGAGDGAGGCRWYKG